MSYNQGLLTPYKDYIYTQKVILFYTQPYNREFLYQKELTTNSLILYFLKDDSALVVFNEHCTGYFSFADGNST